MADDVMKHVGTILTLAGIAIVLVLLTGTVVYHDLEGWSLIDSFYFTAMTVTTIGYGDLTPTTAVSKLFTVLFSFFAIGVVLFTLPIVGSMYFRSYVRRLERIEKRLKPKNKKRKK